jgi:integrase
MTMSDLPKNVRPVADRHGKIRYRFRRKGWPSAYVKGEPGTADFHRSYAEIIERGPAVAAPVKSSRKVAPRSIDDLIARFKTTMRWKKKGAVTTHKQARTLERFTDRTNAKGQRYGERQVGSVTVTWLENVFGQMADTPAAANELRKVLAGLFDCACRMQWRTDNPVRLTEKFSEGERHHTWTEAEIARYREIHPLGTMARFVLELALNTAGRICNVAALTRDDIRDGRIIVDHAKGGNEASVPMLATTKAALDALPAAPIKALVTTAAGKAFTVKGLGNRVRKWCDTAGLPHCSLHGLRYATARRVAESGGTDAEGQAVTGHKKPGTFAGYRAKASRPRLADRALSNVATRFDVQPSGSDNDSDA